MKKAIIAMLFAIGAAGSAVSQLNIVGYVNVPLTNGFNFIANPLDLDGTGTNNTIAGTFGLALPDNSQVYKFSGGGYSATYGFARGAWSAGASNASLNPGEGVVVSLPSPTNFTFVGTVLQGLQPNQYIASGMSLLGSKIPFSGGLQTTLRYTPSGNDIVYLYNQGLNGGFGGFQAYLFSSRAGRWLPSQPSIVRGVGFFLSTTNLQPTWVQHLIVGVVPESVGSETGLQSRQTASTTASPAMVPISNPAVRPDKSFTFTVAAVPNRTPVVEVTTNPADAKSWTVLSSFDSQYFSGMGSTDVRLGITDTNASQFQMRFYRVTQP